MADPSPTARVTPVGIPLGDGFSTKITIGSDPDISFWEKSIQPPGWDGGDPVETTTMHNVTYRTMRARKLKTLTPASGTAAYDPQVFTQIEAQINNETTITITFSDGSTLAFYGYLRQFEPQEIEEGEQPEANFTIEPTNWDPTNNVEGGIDVVSVGSI